MSEQQHADTVLTPAHALNSKPLVGGGAAMTLALDYPCDRDTV